MTDMMDKATGSAGGHGEALPAVDRFCDNCQHWCELDSVLTGRWTPAGQKERLDLGECRIRPPLLGREQDYDRSGRWPTTKPGDWCARWVLREEED